MLTLEPVEIANTALALAKRGEALSQASGAMLGEAMGLLSGELYQKPASALTEEEKSRVSALATLAAGLAGGLIGDSSASAADAAQAGKVTADNNALSSKEEKQRQDAKWSLPYIKDEKQKQQAEKLISELNQKDKAFDTAIDSACKNLSSAACQGMRQELAAMAKSYDEKLDDHYIGTMRSVYGDGAKQVDSLIWKYATADAEAQRGADVTRLAENWGISKEVADTLYSGMAVVHTAAAIGGAAYGVKQADSMLKHPGISGRVLGEYSAIKPGPLKSTAAETFAGGRYKEVILTKDTVLYRAGVNGTPFGQYFSFDKLRGVIQTRIDKAVLPIWANGDASPLDTSFGVKIPAGTKIYIGKTGSQGGFYIGGTEQIHVPTPWKIPGVDVVSKEPLK